MVDNVGAGATEKTDRDGSGSGWCPGDGEGSTNGDNLVESRAGDWVAARGLGVVNLLKSRGDSHEGREDDSGELHCDLMLRC